MVANEFFKSIARTLGRIFAYILLGILAYFIFTWFNADEVKAATITPNTISPYGVNTGGQSWSQAFYNTNTYTLAQTTSNFIYVNGTTMYFPVNVVADNTYTLEFVIDYTLYHENGSFNPTLVFYLNNVTTTCDTNITNSIIQTSTTQYNYGYRHSFKCLIDSTINAGELAFNYYTGLRQTVKNFTVNLNLYKDDASNSDIINNNNQNFDRLIENNIWNWNRSITANWENTQSIIRSNADTQQAVYDNTQAVETMDAHITSESDADISILSGVQDLMPSNTPVTNIITLPINILNREIQSLGGTCSPWTINTGSLLGNNTWTFPCLNISQYFTGYSYSGYNLWQLIDLMICLFMGYEILMLIISSYNGIANLDDSFNDLYQPRHAASGYKPRHAKE